MFLGQRVAFQPRRKYVDLMLFQSAKIYSGWSRTQDVSKVGNANN